MPANTPRGFPYPLPTEPVAEGAQAIRNLAEFLSLGAMSKLAENTLAAPGQLDLSAIPQTYKHLLAVLKVRSDAAAALGDGLLRVNGDTANNYNFQRLEGGNGVASAGSGIGTGYGHCGVIVGGWVGTRWSHSVIFVPSYTEVAPHGLIALYGAMGADAINTFTVGTAYTLWKPEAAITRLTFLPGAGSYVVGASATLYGLG